MIRFKTYISWSLVPLITIMLFLASCSGNDTRMVSSRDLEDILHDVYLADGLLSDPYIRAPFNKRDSIDNYIDIIDSYGYTLEEFENTLRYLYVKNPDRLVKIYDKVLLRFSELESKLNTALNTGKMPLKGIWYGKESYIFSSNREQGYFSQEITTPGIYQMKYDVIVSPADATYNPGFFGWTIIADSAGTGKKNYLPKSTYIKDGHWHPHYVNITVETGKPVMVEGFLYNNNSDTRNCITDAMIRNIVLELTAAL